MSVDSVCCDLPSDSLGDVSPSAGIVSDFIPGSCLEPEGVVSDCVDRATVLNVTIDLVNPVCAADVPDSQGSGLSHSVGEIFEAPRSRGGRCVKVYGDCIAGNCNCVHLVGDNAVDLKPCRAAKFLFGGECGLPPDMVSEIWDGLCDGFRIVDNVDIPSYSCDNYESITKGRFYGEMSKLISKELAEGKISEVFSKPHCVHSLGGVEKSNGKLRPITDCSMPDDISINNFMGDTFKNFSYKSVDDVTRDLEKGDFISVTDISSAYRSVSIFEGHSKYQGFQWEMDGEVKWYQEHYHSGPGGGGVIDTLSLWLPHKNGPKEATRA